ncbi:hypothetical protein [Reinekea thalattae]|uniref:Uncharacterized protein n=1 Tax=Reinekea thalattae TaxID=2593301 RepID=A0A5C8ZAN5_9GAMM|nr:hypothetical protein [Reinekea thalattae]TXR54241.1 hypothetical protein FME95_06815 [Reinekea thalattae]
MDIASNLIQSYQHNQNISGNPASIGASEAASLNKTEDESIIDDEVSISDQRDIYEWVASELPHLSAEPATVSRASQMLYEYQLLDFNDINTMNSVIANTNESGPITEAINDALSESGSYSEKQSLTHLKQVFSTLEAARSAYSG